jgi:propionyl-CoA synthetase
LLTAPTAFRAIKRDDPNGNLIKQYDMSKFKALFLAGERTDPDTLYWAEKKLGVPVIDHWWQTETGWPIVSNCMGLYTFEVRPGSSTKPVPGWDVRVLDDECNELSRGDTGAISIKLPMPPGFLLTLWNADKRFIDTYLAEYPGYYKTADAGFMDEDGYLSIMSRTDDIINVAGHRLSTGGMEEVLAGHPDVAECAVIGVDNHLKGQLPLGFLILNAGSTKENDEVIAEVVQLVRDKIGPVAAFKSAIVVDRLPKTRSGKILRGTMQKIANNQNYTMPATIDDPTILSEIDTALQVIGYSTSRKT